MIRSMIARGAVWALIFTTSFAADAHHAADDESRVVLRMADGHPRPIVTAATPGGETLHLYLDTGAAANVLAARVADGMGLSSGGSHQVMSPADGIVREARVVALSNLTLDGLTLTDVGFLALDLPQLGNVDGVLSVKALADHLVTFDFLRRVIVLEHDHLSAGAPLVMAYDPSPIMTVKASIAGHVMPMHLDTGSPDGITLPGDLAAELRLSDAAVVRENGPLVVKRAQLSGTVEIGPLTLVDPMVDIVDRFRGFGNIGVGFLADSVVTVDQTRHLVRLDTLRRWVDVGGRHVDCRIQGSSAPTVVFISGGSPLQSYWGEIPALLAAGGATAVTFDRPGHGVSEQGTLPRDATTIAGEVRAMLEELDAPRPFIVVGHSLGCMAARVFAQRYPEDVSGLVLLDPGHRDLLDGFANRLEGEERRRWTDFWAETWAGYESREDATAREVQAVPRSLRQQNQASPAEALPVVVVSADPEHPPGFVEWLGEKSRRAWVDHVEQYHLAIASQTRAGRRVVAEGSGHMVPQDRPDLVVDLVTQLVLGSRARRSTLPGSVTADGRS